MTARRRTRSSGGTAKFAGARGTYVQRAASGTPASRDLVEFVVALAD